jgi:ABC-2 type transport system ATP-binding protein
MVIERLVRREGKTILLSTHNLQEAQELCDRLAILERGKVIALDTPDNVRHIVIEDRFLRIGFADALFGVKGESLVRDLKATENVHDVSVEVNQGKKLTALILRVEKDIDLTEILTMLTKSDLKIRSVNTDEPTLEDAFKAIISQNDRNTRSRVEVGG